MSVLRVFLVLIFATLLSSCDQKGMLLQKAEDDIKDIKSILQQAHDYIRGDVRENPCVAGGRQTENCFYVITITMEKDKDTLYQGKNSKRACVQNKRSGNPLEDCDKFNPATRSFKVNGNPDLKVGKDYDLYSQPPSDVLTCHDPDTETGKPTTTCVERTTDLTPVS
jgi:hypothetical protein